MTPQRLSLFAFQQSTGAPVTGHASHISVAVSLDSGEAWQACAGAATEDNATLVPGVYTYPLLTSERNGNAPLYWAKSSVSGVSVIVLKRGVAAQSGCCGGGLEALQNAEQIALLKQLVNSLCPGG